VPAHMGLLCQRGSAGATTPTPLSGAMGSFHKSVLRLSSLVVLVSAHPGCSQSPDDMFDLGASYTWRGQAVDSVTGEVVSHIGFRVLEEPEHEAAGWSPISSAQTEAGTFLFEYDLAGPVCGAGRDTTLVIHLEVFDSLARYRSTVRSSTWEIDYCDGKPAPTPIKPFPSEDGLRVLMQP
jgi:hypothetical protein